MPPTFQVIEELPNDRYTVVYKGTAADDWTDAPGSHSTLEAADAQARDLVAPPDNAYASMVLGPVVAYRKAD